jgi:nucleoside-diphosphate-sugar epimerase
MKRIVITGAGGFIGGHVAEYFRDHGLPPVCLVRDKRGAALPISLSLPWMRCDVTRPDELARAFSGADMVIHTAAKVSEWGKYEDFYRVNVRGTQNVLLAARNAGVGMLILTGSNSCYGEENSVVQKTEESPYHPVYRYFMYKLFPSALNYYRQTKALANLRAMEFASANGMKLTIIEPVWVYGEREFHSGFYEYLRTVKSGLPFFPGCRGNRFHTIYVRDLARLYWLAAHAGFSGVHRYLACDADAEYLHILLGMFCREAGLKPPRPLPKALIYPLAFLLEAAATALHAKHAPMLTRAKINIFYDNIVYSGEKARRELAFQCIYSREQSIRSTVSWYRNNNYL